MSSFTQDSILKLKTKKGLNGKNIIEEMFFTPPLKLISPLEDDDIAEIMLISVSAGLLKDDRQDITIHIGKESKIRLTSQSYEKIHDTQDGYASKQTRIIVEENAFLDYAPLPILPFKNASFKNTTDIYLDKNAKLHYSEILCAGRVACGEIFDFLEFSSKVCIYKDNNLVFFENMNLNPTKMDLQNPCLFDEYTHVLSMIIFDDSLNMQSLEQKIQNSPLNAGISTNNGAIIIRALDNQSERLLDFRYRLLG
ncbi:urease accessory protein UreD [Helicobacter muridarum]|uniref:Urease accessory protein UreD n=1 Tax=Helicobacter muridarum TaxID=216 RepID=A0A099U067_9HELI|nr:urease accessory protein UreD [Helicobacter muridarum]TLE00472.1 urease accessory protein UreD [Helicobacter muridarum]STQ86446.1 urease accessory protein UreH [Helicobacter muridarum]